ncbi:uncharacterized protein DUF3153 [Paenibacillus cellulosilyticus]|uniref:Uncharacterized protein DUF3153 n=1 Tax=Paenibacillus cellulosilyticus TaxID=375489 RepID=A0A2V2YRW6_9BACL|nr:DUF3153 domain-containing protein [Paenibacillus cellulosilyticus]PWV97982.1 uncharacterized protein DUF3153 [Paenibacillus cellulosilyticus]QKS43990.1 DUF3153 domain-containing protein [Paenibacillus cellulosilyticus]
MINSIRSITRTKMLLVLLALSLLITITGCAKGEAELRVRANGTAQLNLTLTLDSTLLQAISGDQIWDTISDELTQHGFEVDPVKSVNGSKTLRASRDIDLKESVPVQIPGVEVTHTTERSSWWYTTEAVSVKADLMELVPDQISDKLSSLSTLVRELALRQIGFDFKLTMPIRAASNNADVVTNGGKSLTWHLSATKVNDIQVEVHVPNVKHIAIVGGAVLILLIAAIILFVRMRRRKRKQT